jgi:excisionase family DNA binding protein
MALLTTRDVQELIRVDRSTIYRMAEDGRLPAVKVGRQWRFPEDEVLAWLGRGGVAAEAPTPGTTNGLSSLVPAATLQALADLVGELLGVMVVITDVDGNPLTDVANACGLFDAVRRIPGSVEHCIEGWREYARAVDLAPRFEPSHLGFLCARGFVRVGSELKGMVIVGGIRPEAWPPPPEQADAMAEDVGMPRDDLAVHIGEVYDVDEARRRWILDSLPKIGDFVSRLANDCGRLVERLDAIADLAGTNERRSTT